MMTYKFSQYITTACMCFLLAFTAMGTENNVLDKVEAYALEQMEEGDIPSLSLVLRYEGKTQLIHLAADSDDKQPGDHDLFEIGSVTKSFTALAVQKLISEGKIDPEKPVAHYLPWLRFQYQGDEVQVQVRDFMHHTSGIPWHSLSGIMPGNAPDALEQTVKNLSGTELNKLPGKAYEYATVNYDVLGYLIEVQSGMSYEEYLREVVLQPLGMKDSKVGYVQEVNNRLQGHKASFFAARPYEAPVYRGNTPAGYLLSSATDMAHWLELHMGTDTTFLSSLAAETRQPDRTVSPNLASVSSYAAGWHVSLKGDGIVFHEGLNPAFASYVGFNEDYGVVVLANSNSKYTSVIGINALNLLQGKAVIDDLHAADGQDKAFTIASVIFALFSLGLIVFMIWRVLLLIKKKAAVKAPGAGNLLAWVLWLAILLPFAYAIYLIPEAMARFDWESALVWSPESFELMAYLAWVSMGLSFMAIITGTLIREENLYRHHAPQLLTLSIVSGLSNTALIILISNSVGKTDNLPYTLFYFGLVFVFYAIGRKVVQTRLVRMTVDIIYDIRKRLLNKIFATSYEEFEKIDRGRINATLNDDTNTISNAASVIVNLITSVITVVGAFFFLSSIALWSAVLVIGIILLIATIYYVVSQKSNRSFEQARDDAGTYLEQLNTLVDGFKELSLSNKKRFSYQEEIDHTNDSFRNSLGMARIRFINAFIIGDSMLVMVLALVAFGLPVVFPDIQIGTLLTFVVVLLYLIGPINTIMSSMPAFMQMRVSWKRINMFLQEIPANIDLAELKNQQGVAGKKIAKLEIEELSYHYPAKDGEGNFGVGPVSLASDSGEINFIIGGNGSGKTTLAKMITGLYKAHEGQIKIDGQEVSASQVGEYYSVVFNPAQLFKKMYDISDSKSKKEMDAYLKLLRLDEKVSIEGDSFSTIRLSSGQRKRLALLQTYMEDKPIMLLDEWAADQDPEYKKVFYRQLLPEFKAAGKIIIAISHDDHYFDVADRVIKLHQGKIEWQRSPELAVNDVL